jgi:hypothetical protein
MNRHLIVRGGLAVLFCAWGLTAFGASYTWNGGGTDDHWSTGLNWSGGSAPGGLATDDVYLAGTVRLTPDVDLNNPWMLGSLSFLSGAGAFTLSGNPLSFQGSVAADVLVNNSGNGQTLDLDLTLAGTGTKTIKAATDNLVLKQKLILNVAGEVKGAADTTIEGIISGTGDLRKDDSGRLVLKGDNTFVSMTPHNSFSTAAPSRCKASTNRWTPSPARPAPRSIWAAGC